MVDTIHVLIDSARRRIRRRSPAVAATALLTAALSGVIDQRSGCDAVAAEVDAIGATAPLGFAEIIEKVKPAVVGVRVKVEDDAISFVAVPIA